MMTANFLVTDFGFKRRVKNKEKLLVNDEYGITLTTLDKISNSFIDVNTGEKYFHTGDIITKFALVDIEKDSKKFHEGLPDINLRQGNFNEAYTENQQRDEYFISHEKAKKLLEAQFNRLLCSSLMIANGSTPNYGYFIKETKYKFIKSDSNIKSLILYYNFKDRTGHHDFWNTFEIYEFDKDFFPIFRKLNSRVPLDLIIEKFLK